MICLHVYITYSFLFILLLEERCYSHWCSHCYIKSSIHVCISNCNVKCRVIKTKKTKHCDGYSWLYQYMQTNFLLLYDSSSTSWADLNTDYQVTLQLTLATMRGYYLTPPPKHTVECTQQLSSNKWKWYICDWAQEGYKHISMLHEEVDQMPIISIPVIIPFAPRHAPIYSLAEGVEGAVWYLKDYSLKEQNALTA